MACSTRGGEYCSGFWWRNLKEGGYYLDLHVDIRIILKLTLYTFIGMAWTAFILLRVGEDDGIL